MILKEPYAGSSWFTAALQQRKGTNIVREFYSHSNIPSDGRSAQIGMTASLSATCAGDESLLGFTQYPNHEALTALPEFDWSFVRQLPGLDIVAWTRSNFILRAFSMLSHPLCGHHNAKDQETASQCRQVKYRVDRRQLLDAATEAVCDNAKVLALSRELSVELGAPKGFHAMTYEAYASDPSAAMQDLFDFVELPLPAERAAAPDDATYYKRSADNVSTMLENPGEVVMWLREWGGIGSAVGPLEAMFHDTRHTPFAAAYDAHRACQAMSGIRARPLDVGWIPMAEDLGSPQTVRFACRHHHGEVLKSLLAFAAGVALTCVIVCLFGSRCDRTRRRYCGMNCLAAEAQFTSRRAAPHNAGVELCDEVD